MKRRPLRSSAAAAAVAVCALHATADAFSFAPQPSKRLQGAVHGSRMPSQWIDDDGGGDDQCDAERAAASVVGGRRGFLSQVVAAAAAPAPVLLLSGGASPASAVSDDPTRIELSVDTEYLIRVLNFFDGDMRKVLGVIVRSPQTTVEIDPPARGYDPNLNPKDAILRALYSYSSPEDYAEQSSWIKVDEPNGLIEFLTKKRYRIYLPLIETGPDYVEGSTKGLEVTIRPTNLNLSNLESAVGLAAVSYPLAYSFYNYESYKQKQEAAKKKAMMKAKKAAKAKAAAAKKLKGTQKTEAGGEAKDVGEGKKKGPPAMKGQEAKKSGGGNTPAPTKKAKNVSKANAQTSKPAGVAPETIEDEVAAEMLDSRRENFIAAATAEKERPAEKVEDEVAAEMLDSKRGNFIASSAAAPDDELGRLVATAAAAASAENGGEGMAVKGPDRPGDLGTDSLRALDEDGNPRRGPFNSYLDSL